VAGQAALVIAKLHKIGERADQAPNRLKNKDASDLFLLLQRTETAQLADTIRTLLALEQIAPSISTALQYLRDLFAITDGIGLHLLRSSRRGIEDEELAAESCMALAQELLKSLE
jgi:hypothetical protein